MPVNTLKSQILSHLESFTNKHNMFAARRHLKRIAPFFLQRPRGFPGRADDDGGDIVRGGGGATVPQISIFDIWTLLKYPIFPNVCHCFISNFRG